MAEIKAQELKKKKVFFGLEDTLIPGRVESEIDQDKVYEILDNLKKLSEGFDFFDFYLISGLREELAAEKIKEFQLGYYFKKENIYSVTEEYVNSKSGEDRKRYLAQIGEDPNFKDEYFKQHLLTEHFLKQGVPKEEMVLIGHDVWREGFYSRRFSQVDFALIKSALSHSDKKCEKIIQGLVYIERDWPSVRKVILGQMEKADFKALDAYVFGHLKSELLGEKGIQILRKSLAEAALKKGTPRA